MTAVASATMMTAGMSGPRHARGRGDCSGHLDCRRVRRTAERLPQHQHRRLRLRRAGYRASAKAI